MDCVDAEGKLAKHLDNHIGSLAYSMFGPSAESLLQYQLHLANASLHHLHTQLVHLQHKCHSLEHGCSKAKEEACLNAAALKRKVGEYGALREKFEQLSRECELYRRDVEVFSEAAEDAEERREEAEKRATEAERQAQDAQRKLESAMVFVEELMMKSPAILTEIEAGRIDSNTCAYGLTQEMDSASRRTDSSSCRAVDQESIGITALQREQESHNSRKVLGESNHNFMDNTKLLRKHHLCYERASNEHVVEHEMCQDEAVGICLEASEKENSSFGEARNTRQVARSDRDRFPLENRDMNRFIKILQNNLLKAELEADIIQARNLELRQLLVDIITTFGISPKQKLHEVYQKLHVLESFPK